MTKKTNLLVGAAVLGMLSAVSAPQTFAADAPANGKCMGANSCGGKSECQTATNDCAGKNTCKGKGYLMMTQAKCKKASKKNAKTHWDAS